MRGAEFAEMNAFLAVAEHGSFTKAAARLEVSTTTVSQTIRALEDRLGVRLLNRTTRSVAVTEAGERLAERLRPLFDGVDDALEAVNAFRDRPAGRVRITVAPPASRKVLAPLLAQFLTRYPEIALDISVDAALADVVADHYDAGIRIGGEVARDMIAVRIMDGMQFVAVASPAYLAGRPAPPRPEDLRTHNCIRWRFPSGAINAWRFTEDGKTREIAVEGTITVNDHDLALRAALDGVGVYYAQHDHVASYVALGRLVPLLQDFAPPPTEPFYLYYPSRRQLPTALQVFIDCLRENARPRPSIAADAA